MKRFLIILAIFFLLSSVLYFFRYDIKRALFKEFYHYLKQYDSKREKTIGSEKNRIIKVLNNYRNNPIGIDLSHYQGKINWKQIDTIYNNFKIKFVVIRATAGINKKDKYFDYNWEMASEKKLIRGAYHYYRPNENSIKQATNFINNVKLHKGDLPPVLDIEELSVIQTEKSLKTGLLRWLNKIEEYYGVKPIIYTGEKFFLSYLNNSDFNKYHLWIANYNNQKGPFIKNYILWQFTDKGQLKGLNENVDLNIFNGTFSDLQKLLIKK